MKKKVGIVRLRINIGCDIDNDIKSNECLAKLSNILYETEDKEVQMDFKKVQFIAANQLAVIAAIVEELCMKRDKIVVVGNISNKVKSIMRKNGFGKHLKLEPQVDKFHTTIPYKFFRIDESEEFEKYLMIYIFQREDIPKMSERARNTIIDHFLEIFNNVKEHASTGYIYSCGQFFPRSNMLYFTICDIGKTIPDNVKDYLLLVSKEKSEKYCIEWALKEGNSTRSNDSPGGLGLSIINRFVELNKGKLMVMSGNEIYECWKNKKSFFVSNYCFRGTIVTIGINMADSFSYLAINDNIEQILF